MPTGGTTWFGLSLLATMSVSPVFVAIPFFGRHFAVSADVFTAWYFASVSMGVAAWIVFDRGGRALFPTAPAATVGIILVGLLLGSVANTCLFRAVILAPNPGLPPVIYSGASILVFLASVALADRAPRLFRPVTADLDRFAGILLVIVGVFLTAGGWPLVTKAILGAGPGGAPHGAPPPASSPE